MDTRTSMLLANMMSQKVEEMPLTVVGSPTISSGVVSGFSSSNYLKVPEYVGTINSLEFVVKIATTPTTITNNALILQLSGVPINIYVKSNMQITFAYKDGNGTIRNLNSLTGIDTIYYKFVLNDTGSYIYSSADGSNWSLLNSYEYIPQISITSGKIGYSTNTYNVYDGSLDIGNSYIKINNTKYQFQFTMPLTVVGTPTITDGVVSGFSSSNYLYLPNFPYVSKDWELVIKANTTYNSSQSQQRLLRINSYFQFQVSLSTLDYQFYYGVEPVFYLGKTNTNYPFVKLIKRDGKIYFSVSQNGVNYIDISDSVTIPSSASDGQLQFGVSSNSWLGSIDLNNSYIIIDGTKYIFTIGA